MFELLTDLVVVGSNEFVPPTDWRAQIAMPGGIIIFFGSIYMLLRSNLGTRRGYLVAGGSFFGFMTILSLFWAFGAPGTPMNTGPQNLPGQPLDYYTAKWVPFAPDSLAAEMPDYSVAQQYPQGWETTPPDDLDADLADEGVQELVNFFASDEAGNQTGETWIPNPDTEILYATAENGRPMMAVEYLSADALGEPTPPPGQDEPQTYLAFGFYDAGNPMLPSLIMIALSIAGFVLHLLLLGWDERRERRDREAVREEERAEPERVPTPA